MPFDVFISFKNTAPNGGLTLDRAIAERIHSKLRDEGLDVFFSERDLDNAAFMNQIYGALEEAQLLILVGTSLEHIKSKWVMSEWRNFLGAINSGKKPNGQMITVLSGISSTDLPIEISNMQSFSANDIDDISKFVFKALGKFSNSEVRERIAEEEERKRKEAEEAALREMRLRMEAERRADEERLQREREQLEQERQKQQAEAAAERERLRLEREKAEQEKQRKEAEKAAAREKLLREQSEQKSKMKLLIGIASAVVATILSISIISSCSLSNSYNKAIEAMNRHEYVEAYETFAKLGTYKNSQLYNAECVYFSCVDLINNGYYKEAISELQRIESFVDNYRDFEAFSTYDYNVDRAHYLYAKELLDNGYLDEAKIYFSNLGSFMDSSELVSECDYLRAMDYSESASYESARTLFSDLGDYKDSEQMVMECDYNIAMNYYSEGHWNAAKAKFLSVREYKDSSAYAALCDFESSRGSELSPEKMKSVFDALSKYSSTSSLCKEACADSRFTIMKLYNAEYTNGYFRFKITDSPNDEHELWMTYRLWDMPEYEFWNFDIDSQYGTFIYITADDVTHDWFKVIAFDDPYSAAPKTVTLQDPKTGATYKLTRY